MSADTALVAALRAEVLAALSERERELAGQGRGALGAADEQALGPPNDRRGPGAPGEGPPCETGRLLSAAEEDEVSRAVFDALFRLNRLQRLLDDPDIENINANGADQVWVRYADGRRERAEPIAESDAELEEMLRTAAARTGIGERRFDRGSPRLSLQLPDGSRLFALMAVSARPSVSIRRHRYLRVTADDLVKMGTLDLALREFLRAAMLARKSCISCGGTGAGKTTLLRAMAADIPPEERLVTIEDSLELGLDRFSDLHPDVVALEAREPNLEGEGGVSLAELVRWALRMSPDRVIVGEARGVARRPACRSGTWPTPYGCCGGFSGSPGPTGWLQPASIRPRASTPRPPTRLWLAPAGRPASRGRSPCRSVLASPLTSSRSTRSRSGYSGSWACASRRPSACSSVT